MSYLRWNGRRDCDSAFKFIGVFGYTRDAATWDDRFVSYVVRPAIEESLARQTITKTL